MNELKLSLQNFQSISEGELTFQTGLNFIVGQSNSGKSATFRAIKACLLNPAGSQRFIKRDANKTVVELKYNGNDICWDKSKKENSYTINGEYFRNTGKSDAFKILDNETGFVKAEKGCVLMNIEEELQLPFPFGIPDSELFKLFENIFCVSDSAVILKSAKEHEDKVKGDIGLLDLEETKVQTKINCLTEFKKEVDLDLLREYKRRMEDKERRITTLNDGLSTIKLALKLSNSNLNIINREFEDLSLVYSEICEIKNTLVLSKNLHKLSKGLQKLRIDTTSKVLELKELQELKGIITRTENLSHIPDLSFNLKENLSKYTVLIELNKTTQRLKNLHKIKIKEEIFENFLQQLRDLKTLRSYLDKIKGEITELKANKKREEEKVASIEEKLKEFKVCPLCHHSLEN